MADFRCFRTNVFEESRFDALTPVAKVLYFVAVSRADDCGFFEGKRGVLKQQEGAVFADFQELVENGLIIDFKDDVFLLADWWKNNRKLNKTRAKDNSFYSDYLEKVTEKKGVYILKEEVIKELVELEKYRNEKALEPLQGQVTPPADVASVADVPTGKEAEAIQEAKTPCKVPTGQAQAVQQDNAPPAENKKTSSWKNSMGFTPPVEYNAFLTLCKKKGMGEKNARNAWDYLYNRQWKTNRGEFISDLESWIERAVNRQVYNSD